MMKRGIMSLFIFCVTHTSQLWADVQVQGYLNKAALENLASDPTCSPASTCPDGRIYWNTTANEPRMWDGSAWQEIPIGASTVPDPLLLGSGSTLNPTYSFSSDSNTGMFNSPDSYIGFSVNNDLKASFGSSVFRVYQRIYSEVNGSEAAPAYTFSSSGDDDGMWLSGSSLRFSTSGTEAFVIGSSVNRTINQLQGPDGSETAPAFSFTNDSNAGMYLDGSNIRFSGANGDFGLTVGSGRTYVGNQSFPVSATSSPQLAFSGDTNTGMFRTASSAGLTLDSQEFVSWGGNTSVGTVLRIGSFTSPTTSCINLSGSGLRNLRACSSSIRYKKDVKKVTDSDIDKMMELEPVTFTWKESGARDYGMIAEDFQKQFPLLIQWAPPPGKDDAPKDEWVIQSINYRHFTALLLAQNQRQERQIEELTKRIEALENQ